MKDEFLDPTFQKTFDPSEDETKSYASFGGFVRVSAGLSWKLEKNWENCVVTNDPNSMRNWECIKNYGIDPLWGAIIPSHATEAGGGKSAQAGCKSLEVRSV